MTYLSDAAQAAMDLYYQNFATDDDFLKLYHFDYVAGGIYATLLQTEYEQSYARGLRDLGVGVADINPEWFIPESLTTENKGGIQIARLPRPAFSFRFDKHFSGIQDVEAAGNREFIRITADERYKLKHAGTTENVYWYLKGRELFFHNSPAGLKDLVVYLIPALSYDGGEGVDGDIIPDALRTVVIQETWKAFAQARQGTVVDMTNDGNPNKTIGTEINSYFQNR